MQVEGKFLFPLINIIPLRGSMYYMDAEGEVYSTKTGRPVRLSGSNTKSGRYYTLSGRTFRHDFLKASAQRDKMFKAETSAPAGVKIGTLSKEPDSLAETLMVDGTRRSFARNMQEAISLRGVMIATVDGEKLVFGMNPKIHVTEQSFKDEMTRLAQAFPGTKFVAVKIIQSVVAGTVRWE